MLGYFKKTSLQGIFMAELHIRKPIKVSAAPITSLRLDLVISPQVAYKELYQSLWLLLQV
jgi:hypothetical protein